MSSQFDRFFADAPQDVNMPAILEYWEALSPAYDVGNWLLPLPPWRHRPYQDSPSEAWVSLSHDLAHADPDKPFCIYMHVPFCSSKCGFCDNYSFKLGSRQAAVIQEYVDRLCYELRLWSRQGNLRQRPVSTVHLGGGTPTFLGEAALRQIVNCCREHFAISPDTEWALESTVQGLSPEMICTMHDTGFRRLHIGVQTLEETVRSRIGRRNASHDVLSVIEQVLALGWIVSVDLICGLPNQTLRGFVDGIQTLMHLGVNGFSIYELLIYPQNRRWCEQQHLTDINRHLPNYWMFLSGALLLEAHGYLPNLFNHWADSRDQNVYFTFPTRGEDLLAVGTIADGVFNDYHYRHPRFARYMDIAHSGLPGLEGGLRRDAYFNMLQPITTAIQAGRMSPGDIGTIHAVLNHSQCLLERWWKAKLIRSDGQGGYTLTPSGSWFAGNLIAELTDMLEASRPVAGSALHAAHVK